jgi:hypothetical protein
MSAKPKYYTIAGGFVACTECGACVMNVQKHTQFHEELEKKRKPNAKDAA